MLNPPELTSYNCRACGHDWIPRTPQPKACPGCHSRAWHREPLKRGRKIKQHKKEILATKPGPAPRPARSSTKPKKPATSHNPTKAHPLKVSAEDIAALMAEEPPKPFSFGLAAAD